MPFRLLCLGMLAAFFAIPAHADEAEEAGLPVPRFVSLRSAEVKRAGGAWNALQHQLGLPAREPAGRDHPGIRPVA